VKRPPRSAAQLSEAVREERKFDARIVRRPTRGQGQEEVLTGVPTRFGAYPSPLPVFVVEHPFPRQVLWIDEGERGCWEWTGGRRDTGGWFAGPGGGKRNEVFVAAVWQRKEGVDASMVPASVVHALRLAALASTDPQPMLSPIENLMLGYPCCA